MQLVFSSNKLQPLHGDCLQHRTRFAECFGEPPFDKQTFTIWQCQKCGIGFTDPIPTSESAGLLYETRESNDFQAGDAKIVSRLKHYAAMRDVRAFCGGKALPSDATILDFSCGNGAFAHALQCAYPNASVYGTDAHAEPPRGMTCSYLPHHQLYERQSAFDFILCRHVLEHSYDPIGLATFLRDLLVPGGMLAIEVPSLETPFVHLFGKHSDQYYAPFHPIHFTRTSLASVVQAAGFKIVRQAGAEMPKMGRSLRNVLGCQYNVSLFAAGMLLYPLQVAIGAISRQPSGLRVWAVKQ
jgi:SAM-dependent methyltransferase